MEIVIRLNDAVNEFAWGSFGLVLIIGAGIICTLATGFFQITKIEHWFKNTFGIINGRGRIINDAGALSQRRAFWTALAATLGTGNISGVATAICLGGPGAVFWMWIAAIFGMMIKYSENLLGVYYRRRNPEGAWSGGPMYYLTDGLGSLKHCKWLGKALGIIFCVFTILASFGAGNMVQINKISLNVEATFLAGKEVGKFLGVSNIFWAIGAVLMIAMAAILMGGFRRLAAMSEVVMPFLCAAYIIGCLLVIAVNITRLPEAFASIFRFAFRTRAVAGGTAGTALAMTINSIQYGCKRGVFSNEAGMGSSVMLHVTSCNREPVHQGLWGIAEVFVDTIVICTFTALVILCSGFIDLRTGVAHDIVNDATLVTEVFGASLGKPGEWFVVIIITMFAFTTVLGWSYYGSKVTEYLFGVFASKTYRVVFLFLIVAGAVMEPSLAWDISDTFNGLMMIPNLIGVLSQIPLIIRLTKNYTDRKIKGKDIEPILSYNSDIQAEALRAIQKGAD